MPRSVKRKKKKEQTPYDWEIRELDQGTGCICPRCGGKLVIDLDRMKEERVDQNLHSMLCPYCERMSLMEELKR